MWLNIILWSSNFCKVGKCKELSHGEEETRFVNNAGWCVSFSFAFSCDDSNDREKETNYSQ